MLLLRFGLRSQAREARILDRARLQEHNIQEGLGF